MCAYLGHGSYVHRDVVAEGDAAPPARRHVGGPARRALTTDYELPKHPTYTLRRPT